MRYAAALGVGLTILLPVLVVSGLARGSEPADWKHYGAAFTLPQAVPLAELMRDPAAQVDRPVRVEGQILDVCTKKGCWMMLSAGQRSVRVTMKDYGFFVPTDSSGALADLEGTLLRKPADPEAQAHYAAEAARPELVQQGGGDVYELVATAIRIRR
jgi:hypothetical protein